MPPPRWQRWALLALVLTYAVGVVGLAWPASRPLFLALTPAHLLLTLAAALAAQPGKSAKFWLAAAAIFLGGYLVEVAGVATGALFGSYHYGPPFGPQLWRTPPLIGANWLLLTLCCAEALRPLAARLKVPFFLHALAAAALLTAMDYLLEPVAMRLGFWHWLGDVVPLRNYAMWFLCGLAFAATHLAATRRPGQPPPANSLALPILLLQALFFVFLQLLLG